MEKMTITRWTNGLPDMTASKTDVTHCITNVGEIEEQLVCGGDYVMPEFEFRVDNAPNQEYFPNYPGCVCFLDYYNAYIKGDRVHVDVVYITATGKKSIFYGALDSTIPALNLKTNEITFRATHIIKSGLTDASVESMIQKYIDPQIASDIESTRAVSLWALKPNFFGYNQVAAYGSFNIINSGAVKTGLTTRLFYIGLNYVRQYRKAIDWFGDFVRAFSGYIAWDNHKVRIYDIAQLFEANAAVAIDDELSDVIYSGPWEDSADDVDIECGENSYSTLDKRDADTTGRRPFTVNDAPNYKYVNTKLKKRTGRFNNTKIVDAGLFVNVVVPAYKVPSDGSGRRPFTTGAGGGTTYVPVFDFVADRLYSMNYDFWAKFRMQLDCEALGLNYYIGRRYTIQGKEYRCVQTTKNLELEKTRLKLVARE
jgi:hypothetical protein